jgi:hypothetical protein
MYAVHTLSRTMVSYGGRPSEQISIPSGQAQAGAYFEYGRAAFKNTSKEATDELVYKTCLCGEADLRNNNTVHARIVY